MLYAYSEKFVLVFSHDEVVHGKGSMAGKMPGDTQEKKFANLRAAYGFMMGHPGRKLLFMGQDFGQMDEWNENRSLEWELLEYPIHSQMQEYVKELNHLYRTHPALYEKDDVPEGFEWINCTYQKENIVIFVRRTEKPEETLLFVCNFVPVAHEKFQLGVPFAGKYKEILNSDDVRFGGSGMVNPRVKTSKKEEWDARENSIVINLAPLSVCVFQCTPESKEAKSRRSKNTAAGKNIAAGKEAAAEKSAVAKVKQAMTEAVSGPVKKAAEAKQAIAGAASRPVKKAAEAKRAAKEAVEQLIKGAAQEK